MKKAEEEEFKKLNNAAEEMRRTNKFEYEPYHRKSQTWYFIEYVKKYR